MSSSAGNFWEKNRPLLFHKTYEINFIAYWKVFSIALPDGLFDVRKSTVNMGDFSLNDLLRRTEPLVEDLIWYFKSGMLKGGRLWWITDNFYQYVSVTSELRNPDRFPLTSKHLMSAILWKWLSHGITARKRTPKTQPWAPSLTTSIGLGLIIKKSRLSNATELCGSNNKSKSSRFASSSFQFSSGLWSGGGRWKWNQEAIEKNYKILSQNMKNSNA